ncbi:MAG: GumC family protein [Devosia sp.]
MTVVSDIPERTGAGKAPMRAYARLGNDNRSEQAVVSPVGVAPEAVTLEKIGDFLELDLRRVTVWLRSGLLLIGILAVVGGVGGALYSTFSKPRYTVTTDVLIDPADLQLFDDNLFATKGQFDNVLLVTGSKVRILTSRNVFSRVANELGLGSDPEFYDPNSLFGGAKSAGDENEAAAISLASHVSTQLDEKSFVISLSVSSQATDKAIAISASMIQAFKDELAATEADGATRAAAALDQRLSLLRTDVQTAEKNVANFKRDNNLVSSNGELVAAQSLTQLNTDLVAAQTRAASAQADYKALLAGDANSRPDSSISTGLISLRDKAAVTQQELSSDSAIYGPLHPRVVSLKGQVATIDAQIKRELARTIAVAKGEADQTAEVAAALTDKVKGLSTDNFSDGDLQVKLHELEREASAKTSVYENFLAREKQVAELEQISTTNVRTISTAVPPPGRAWPPGAAVMGIGGAIGGGLAGAVLVIALGLFRDLRGSRRGSAATNGRA